MRTLALLLLSCLTGFGQAFTFLDPAWMGVVSTPAVAGGGSASISAITEATRGTDDLSLATAAMTFTTTAGRAYVVFVKNEVNQPVSITMSGANSGTLTAGNSFLNGGSYGRMFYVTAIPNSGSTTFTGACSGGAGQYNRNWLIEVTYTGTATIDVSTSTGTGTGTTATSASFSTAAAVEAVIAGCANTTGKTYSSYLVAGSAGTSGTAYSDSTVWWRSLTSTVSSQTASVTYTGSTAYAVPVISIQVN